MLGEHKGEAKSGKKTKPVDKPSRYVAVPSSCSTGTEASEASSSLVESALGSGCDTASTSATAASPVRKRRQVSSLGDMEHGKSHELVPLERLAVPESPKVAPWQRNIPTLRRHDQPGVEEIAPVLQSSEIRITSTPATTSPVTLTPSERSPASPRNPYLPSLSRAPRSSSEYLAAHIKFFKPPSPPLMLSNTSMSSHYEDVDALEAQTERPSHHRSSSEAYLKPNGAAAGSAKKGWSGVNLLEAVDDAVSWGVDKVVKWTDEAGDEGLLLPIMKSETERAS